ncbi:MAG: ATP-binding protein, partial [Acidimicrobiia bacterium]|nr:ATP-binding protein [Acidimicrobiia bacterium]
AHNGVLFLDELAEYPRSHLDALRQPLEEGELSISRQGASVTFPARFQLIGASNPCPCGFLGDYRRPCVCGEAAVMRYRRRLSGPLLDRFDISVAVPRIGVDDYHGSSGESTGEVVVRVAAARRIQGERGRLNRDLAPDDVRGLNGAGGSANSILRKSMESGELTARGADKVRRVARTIADLEGTDVGEGHMAEALRLRAQW